MNPLVPVVVGAAALLAVGAGGGSSSSSGAGGSSSSSGAGWTASNGVDITPKVRAFLDRLVKTVTPGTRVHVTSGRRSAERQASALYDKRRLDGDANVRKLYKQKDLIDEILAAPNDKGAMAEILRAQEARGRYLSGHQRDDAVDLRVVDQKTGELYPQREIDNLLAGVKRAGGKGFLEKNPYHIHTDVTA